MVSPSPGPDQMSLAWELAPRKLGMSGFLMVKKCGSQMEGSLTGILFLPALTLTPSALLQRLLLVSLLSASGREFSLVAKRLIWVNVVLIPEESDLRMFAYLQRTLLARKELVSYTPWLLLITLVLPLPLQLLVCPSALSTKPQNIHLKEKLWEDLLFSTKR